MSGLRIASYTVKADSRQAVRWHRHAAAEGFPSVGAWIAVTVERYLKLRDRPVPLYWSPGRFTVTLDGGESEVAGVLSPPFGIFRGTFTGPKLRGLGVHTLVYRGPDQPGRVLATVRYRREARALAAELARQWLREAEPALPPGGGEQAGRTCATLPRSVIKA